MKIIQIKISIFILPALFLSCNKMLEVPVDPASIPRDKIFSTDISATSAVAGIYFEMLNTEHFSGGGNRSITQIGGLSADELVAYYPGSELPEFYSNAIKPENTGIRGLWSGLYKIVYQANSVIEGLADAPGVSEGVKKQLIGEARFIRAFCNFYLVNLFGAVPLPLTADYRQNSLLPRADPQSVYQQIIDDLQAAQGNLNDEYPGLERIRVNSAAATAMLARVYLFLGDWRNAELHSTAVIEDNRYQLPAEIKDVFLKSSPEVIWHLKPQTDQYNTNEAYYSILTLSPVVSSITQCAVTDQLLNSFSDNDKRKTEWFGSYTEAGETWYYPYKYKAKQGEPQAEYSVVFRLAEQYLIRSEARAHLEKLEEAKADLDATRIRAGLDAVTADNKELLIEEIKKEKRAEFFTEWGHRWLDLKRWKDADNALASVKPSWQASDTLYPLPWIEIQRNPNLKLQNPGY